jgi:hypothetical protein
MATREIFIGKTPVQVEDVEMNQVELLFYPDNPRVHNAMHSSENENPSQEELEKKMCALDSVKKLKVNIDAMGGLLQPIVICKNVVLEGNSRLAAYRLLAKENKVKWSRIKCTKLPDDIGEELILAFLGSVHLVGQTPWSPFEKASYIYRVKNKSRRPVKAMAEDMGLNVAEAELYVEVYETMLNAEDVKPTKWSYYFELMKNKSLRKVEKDYPQMEIVSTIVDKIKHDELEEAKDVRKIGDIAKSKHEDAIMILTEYLHDDIPLDDAVELASDLNKAQTIKKGFEKFQKLLSENIIDIQNQTKLDTDLNLIIRNIEDTIKGLIVIK